ncbi:MAG: hypothetical protein HPY69_21050 [Armatimonadetes bacterium]|nr:hypothetical protein [Armatimonadota bacterium]
MMHEHAVLAICACGPCSRDPLRGGDEDAGQAETTRWGRLLLFFALLPFLLAAAVLDVTWQFFRDYILERSFSIGEL